MKIKYMTVYAAVAIAFAAVSLWLALSGGRNASAIRAKFRLGGILLSISAILSTASCSGQDNPFVTCYDPVMPNEVWVSQPEGTEYGDIKVGYLMLVNLLNPSYDSYRYNIFDENNVTLQEGELVFDKETSSASFTIAETTFKGTVVINVFGVDGEGQRLIWRNSFNLK